MFSLVAPILNLLLVIFFISFLDHNLENYEWRNNRNTFRSSVIAGPMTNEYKKGT